MYLGIDLGTSELKLLLLSRQHQVVASTGVALSIRQPQALWSEQDPLDWWQALDSGMRALAQTYAPQLRQVRAIGLSGQMHGAVLLDGHDALLRPAMLWNDGRSADQCVAMAAQSPPITDIAGNLPMPGFTAPKLRWVREHEPALFARLARVLLPKDYLRLRLTGEYATDYSDASGTLWLDVAARRWSGDLLGRCGLDITHMPALVDGDAVSGQLLPAPALAWGLRAGIPVAGGAGDNAASSIGMGRVATGEGFVSLGTSGVVFVNTRGYRPNPAQAVHAFCHTLPRRWHQMSVMLSAASAASWAARAFGFTDVAQLLAQAQSLTDTGRRDAPLFLPYLSGERSPHNDPFAQGVLFGMTHAHAPAALAYAIVEGVCFGLLDGCSTLSTDAAEPITELSLVGGGARSAWWAQLLSDTLGLPLTTHEGALAGAALGAARLGWLADGGAIGAVLRLPAIAARYEPQAAQRRLLLERHARYRALYTALRGQFQR